MEYQRKNEAKDKYFFYKDSKMYILKRKKGESWTEFLERGWYTINLINPGENLKEKYIRIGNIWSNIKFRECDYSKEVLKLISK